ncbi:hypothetical protein [Streptomyces sp. NPDC057428]|uniref:hypothetical protein n=1 Tax=Streptomyces sp. NPDC057428 TaxID=3346129 RepID=UPI0036786032
MSLQEQLVHLESGEQVLIKMQAVLESTAEPSAPAADSRATVSVPPARRARSKSAPRKRAGESTSETAKPKSAAVKKDSAPKSAGEPTWRELVGKYLSSQREPKSSAEVAAALTEDQPKRGVQVAVVRNTLEQGVAQGLLERHKQGRSVFYSVVAAGASAGVAPESAEALAR